jgi:hypothetical protein
MTYDLVVIVCIVLAISVFALREIVVMAVIPWLRRRAGRLLLALGKQRQRVKRPAVLYRTASGWEVVRMCGTYYALHPDTQRLAGGFGTLARASWECDLQAAKDAAPSN